MPRECTVCVHEQSGEIAKDLLAGATIRSTAQRFDLGMMAVQRHRTKCLRFGARSNTGAKPAERSAPGPLQRNARPKGSLREIEESFDGADDLSPQALLRRAASQLDDADRDYGSAESENHKAQARRDRREALKLVMQVQGMLAPDGAVSVVVDQREQISLEVAVASLPTGLLRIVALDATEDEFAFAFESIERRRAGEVDAQFAALAP